MEASYKNQEIVDDYLYTIGVQNFHYLNLKEFLDLSLEEVSVNQSPRVISTSSLDILVEYLSSHHKHNYDFDKRLILLD